MLSLTPCSLLDSYASLKGAPLATPPDKLRGSTVVLATGQALTVKDACGAQISPEMLQTLSPLKPVSEGGCLPEESSMSAGTWFALETEELATKEPFYLAIKDIGQLKDLCDSTREHPIQLATIDLHRAFLYITRQTDCRNVIGGYQSINGTVVCDISPSSPPHSPLLPPTLPASPPPLSAQKEDNFPLGRIFGIAGGVIAAGIIVGGGVVFLGKIGYLQPRLTPAISTLGVELTSSSTREQSNP